MIEGMDIRELDMFEVGEELVAPPRYITSGDLKYYSAIEDMDNAEYHAESEHVSASILKNATTPRKYREYIANGLNVADKTALTIGSYTHDVLEGRSLDRYRIYNEKELLAKCAEMRPDIEAKNLKRTAEWKTLVAPYRNADGSMPEDLLTDSIAQSVATTCAEIRASHEGRALLADAMTEVSIFAEFEDVRCKCRPDIIKVVTDDSCAAFGAKKGDIVIGSIKTTIDASPFGFEREVEKHSYALAEALYHDIITASMAGADKKVIIVYICIEKDKNGLTGEWMLRVASPRHIARGREAYEAALGVIAYCEAHPEDNAGYEYLNNGSHILTIN